MANNNGNITLFLLSLFTTVAPSYPIFKGRYFASTFFFSYLLIIYGLIYFTTAWNVKYNAKYAKNDNETHY